MKVQEEKFFVSPPDIGAGVTLIYGLSVLYRSKYPAVFFRIFTPHDRNFEIFFTIYSPFFPIMYVNKLANTLTANDICISNGT